MRKTMQLSMLLAACVAFTACGQMFGLWGLDPEFQWWTLETEHFRIHFHDGLEGVAHQTALIAEDAYATLREEFGGAPETIDLMLADPFDFSNGYANPFFDQIGIFAAQPRLSDWSNVRLDSWWEMVVFHEIVHAIDLDRTQGFPERVRSLLGKISLPNMWKPWSFVEGLAVYMKYKHLGESRLNDARTLAMIRQMVLDGAIPSFDELRQFYDRQSWPTGGQLIYNFSSWFMRYIEESAGPDALRRINDVNASRTVNLLGPTGLGADFDSVIRDALDVSLDELYSGFQAWLRREFAPEIVAIEAAGVTTGLRLTRLGFETDAPAWSPDGAWIAYSHRSPIRAGLRLMRPDGTQDREIVSGSVTHPSWTPDGRSLVYTKLDFVSPYYILGDIYLYDLESAQVRRLTHGERAYFTRVAPDGRHVYYACNVGRDGSTALRRLDLATGSTETLREFPGSVLHSFALSPDGEEIALSLWRPGGFQDLYLMDTAGDELTPVTQDRNEVADPCWTPDGAFVLFASDPGRVTDVYAYHVEEDQMYRVTRTMTYAGYPSISPDGTQFAFVGYGSAGYDIYVLPLKAESWAVKDMPRQAVPAWTGYPTTDYPIRPYELLPGLMPAFWLPVPIDGGLGVVMAGQDPLGAHFYYALLGWDWVAGRPAYELSYTLRERFPITADLAGGRWGDRQAITLSLPLALGMREARALSLSYRHASGPEIPSAHTIGTGLSLQATTGADLARRSSSLRLDGSITVATLDRHHALTLSWRESLRLPVATTHWISLGVEAAWTDATNSTHHFRLGGTEGRYALRGFPYATQVGPQAIRVAAAHQTPLLRIHRNLGHRPLFLDTLWARFVVEGGVAGAEIRPEDADVSYALELTLTAVASYVMPVSATVGLAQGLGEPVPVLYFSLSVEAPF